MRQTSWLYTKRSKGIQSGKTKTNPVSNRVEGLNLRPPDYKPQRPDYSVTLPPEVITPRIRIIANTPANDCYTICFIIFYFFPGTKYGQGVYFARDASYSLHYTGNGDAGRHMYLARVLVGKYCTGKQDIKVPPPIDPSRPEVLYDSVVDQSKNPSIFVVFHDSQCYPEYHVTFE